MNAAIPQAFIKLEGKAWRGSDLMKEIKKMWWPLFKEDAIPAEFSSKDLEDIMYREGWCLERPDGLLEIHVKWQPELL